MAARRKRLQPQGVQVALSDRRVQARIGWIKADRLHPLIPRQSPRWWKLYKARAVLPSNASSEGSRTSGRYCRSGSVDLSGSSFTLT